MARAALRQGRVLFHLPVPVHKTLPSKFPQFYGFTLTLGTIECLCALWSLCGNTFRLKCFWFSVGRESSRTQFFPCWGPQPCWTWPDMTSCSRQMHVTGNIARQHFISAITLSIFHITWVLDYLKSRSLPCWVKTGCLRFEGFFV